MVEKGIRGRVHRDVKANNKYMKDYDQNKESPYLKYWDVNNLHRCAMLQKIPIKVFKWVLNKSKFNKDFTENYNKDTDME